jgi:hypothetical protein
MRKLILLLLAACASGCVGAESAQPAAGSHAAILRAGPGAAGQGGAATGAAQPAAAADATLRRIQALVGTPSCSSDAQCHSLALGARACGGPERYLAWSSAHTQEAELQALGAQYQAERRAANTADGRTSNCRFMPDPGAVCKAGTCQPNAGGGGPGAQ